MNFCGKRERNQNPVDSAGLPCSFHQPEAPHTEQNSSGEKPVRVKRHRTRRERNYVKFGRNSTDSALEQRPSCRGLQKALPPFWSSQLTSCTKSASFKGISGAKPIIITQKRLSHHLGMFNKEVKSVNIERLLNPRREEEIVGVTPLQRDGGVDAQMGEENQTGKSAGSDQRTIPCEQLGTSANNPSGKNEGSLPTVVPAVSAVVTEHCSTAPVNMADAGSQSSAAPAAVEVNQQSEFHMAEADPCQSDGPGVGNEKENAPPVSPAGVKSHKGKSLTRELAHDLEKRLDLKVIFPGRNLINETRQTVINILLEQKRRLPDFSALARYKELACSSKGDAVQAGFKTPAGRGQELRSASKSSGGSRNFGQGVSLKKRRARDLFFLNSPVHAGVKMHEGRPSRGEDFFAEPDGSDQQSFGLAGLQHLPRPLSSQHVNSTMESPLVSKGQCPLQKSLLKTAWPWEQGLRDILQEPRSRQERTKVAYRPLQKSAAQRHCLPFSTWDSWSLANVSSGDRSSQFPVKESQQYSYVNELGSEQWSFQKADPRPVHGLHLSQEQWNSQGLGVGLRLTERAASESQTSFDVLKSIWSPNVPSSQDRCPVPQTPGYCFLSHQPSSLRELNSNQEELFQLYSISPKQNCCSRKQNPLREIYVPSTHPPKGHRVFSRLAKPSTHRHKFALEPGRTSNIFPLWGLTEASVRTQATSEKGCPASKIQACSRERLSQMEGLQQLRLFQQLPMSYFPPSEVLENKHSPLHTLQGHLQGQSSPEPWAFPRMKLY